MDATATRLACSVPYCQRTRKGGPGEWICGKHWPLTEPTLRRKFYRLKRRARRTGRITTRRAMWWAWDKLKRQVIERAAGI